MSRRRRYWKVWDLVGLFNDHAKGHIPFRCVTNHNMEEPFEFFSVKLDPAWPDGVPDGDELTRVTMKYEIESNIQVPLVHGRRDTVNNMIETMTALECGQSFFVPLLGDDDRIARLATAFGSAKKSFTGKLFISRKVSSNEKEIGLRIWRLE